MKLYLVDKGREYTYINAIRLRIKGGKLLFHYIDDSGENRSETGNIPDEINIWESNATIYERLMRKMDHVRPEYGEDGSKERYRYIQWLSCKNAIDELFKEG